MLSSADEDGAMIVRAGRVLGDGVSCVDGDQAMDSIPELDLARGTLARISPGNSTSSYRRTWVCREWRGVAQDAHERRMDP